MSNKTKEMDDGGNAFPEVETERHEGEIYQVYSTGGMSLRDWFAGQALMGLLASGQVQSKVMVAEFAYKYADEMIAQRKPQTEDKQ